MVAYKKVTIDGVCLLAHRYIWEQQNGPVPAGMLVHHINHNKIDNRIENLELMSPGDHSRHHNQKHPTIKTCVVCAEEFEPHPTKRKRAKTCSRDCFRALASAQRTENNGMRKIDEEMKMTIYGCLQSGLPGKDVAQLFGISRAAVSRIKNDPLLAQRILEVVL